jgi:23S rRNA (cytidine1920-2'-O)/16S rRNA (cytidine1409-2'-O)-methyltransferase
MLTEDEFFLAPENPTLLRRKIALQSGERYHNRPQTTPCRRALVIAKFLKTRSCASSPATNSTYNDQMKLRIDKLLVERGMAPSRERAQALVLAGRVLVNEQKIEKAGAGVEQDAEIRLLGEDLKYVGRGGLKLEAALEHWNINLIRRTCLDIGASTGGFTDCMLQHGAAEVVAVDTGYGQIAARLRSDARVKLLEKTNARYLTPEVLAHAQAGLAEAGTRSQISFIALDVSFISVTLVLPAVLESAFDAREAEHSSNQPKREVVVLVKPQFEVGRELVGKGGIVKDERAQQGAVLKVRQKVEALGGRHIESMESPILGAEGNREFLLHAEF